MALHYYDNHKYKVAPLTNMRIQDSVFTCLDSCSDSSGGCDAQALLAKVDHGLIAPLFGLHNILIYFLQGDISCTFLVAKPSVTIISLTTNSP